MLRVIYTGAVPDRAVILILGCFITQAELLKKIIFTCGSSKKEEIRVKKNLDPKTIENGAYTDPDIDTLIQCCGSKYIEFGSGSRVLAQFGSVESLNG